MGRLAESAALRGRCSRSTCKRRGLWRFLSQYDGVGTILAVPAFVGRSNEARRLSLVVRAGWSSLSPVSKGEPEIASPSLAQSALRRCDGHHGLSLFRCAAE